MKITREIDIEPIKIEHQLGCNHIEVICQGSQSPFEILSLDLDEYAKTLIGNLERWIRKNIK